jgi:histidyl-tRNA synthetase
VIIGNDEAIAQQCQLKNLLTGEQILLSWDDLGNTIKGMLD